MKVLEVNKYLYPRRGAEKHLLDLVDLLKEAGHEVKLFGMEHPQNVPLASRFSLPRYVGYNQHDSTAKERLFGVGRIFWSREAKRKLETLLDAWQPDVAHIHNIYHQLSFSVLGALKERGIPLVMTVHDFASVSPDKDAYYDEVGAQYWKFLFFRKYSFAKRLLLVLRSYWERYLGGYTAYVDVFLVPSIFVGDTLTRAGISEEKIVLLPHFIAHNKTPLTAVEGRYLLSLTGASEEKNTPWLEGVCVNLGIPLFICGDVEEGYAKNASPHITYAGRKNQEELVAYWQGAKAGVSASLLPETFGLVALEGQSYGKPFLCFDTGAYSEVVLPGCGKVAKNQQEFVKNIEGLWNGENTYLSAGEIQTLAYERFGKEKYKEEFLRLLRNLNASV
jgi:glycosyltransferase involved in cell wall biosynthesis